LVNQLNLDVNQEIKILVKLHLVKTKVNVDGLKIRMVYVKLQLEMIKLPAVKKD